MRLTVSKIPESGIEEELELPLSLTEGLPEQAVHISVKADKFGDRIFLTGSASTVATLECSRCLEHFSAPIDVSFSTEYVPAGEYSGEGEHELKTEELDVSTYVNDTINVGDAIREHIILALPMKPLCSEGCKGICNGCGRNLNRGSCRCAVNEIDPRLEPLRNFKIKKSGNK